MLEKAMFVTVALAFALTSYAAEDQAYLAILAETSVMKMPGMPKIELPPGIDLSKVPGAEAMLGMGTPQRKLEVRLWSPGIAPDDAFARLNVPPGLKQGSKLDLALYRPKPTRGKEGPGSDTDSAEEESSLKATMKIYWGCSDTVRPGQPRIIKWESLTPEARELTRKQTRAMEKGGESYFYKPDWTTGYWPTQKQPGKIAPDASLVGRYELVTNYTGGVAIEAPSNVDFLAPFDLTSPNTDEPLALDKSIQLAWKQIPNALGIYVSVVGMEGKSTIVMWNCSETEADTAGLNWDYMQMAEVRDLVQKGVMLKGEATSCSIPAGIFKDCSTAFLTMIAYGPGAALDKTNPLPRIQTKSTFSMPLVTKGVPGMGGMPEPDSDGNE
ncbi:MAG: hypothetical protein ACP5R5_08110 [Armatimonadota bacterium]